MSGINEDFVEKLKYNVNIVDIIADYVPLKKAGNNYKGLCPFHQEKTPSFNVNLDKQLYYCFGCGAGGDVISFLMDLENTTFRETLKILADHSGMVMPANNNPHHQKQREERERIFQLNKLSAKFYHYLLINSDVGEVAANYLAERGFSKEYLRKFKLGYAPNKWQSLVRFLNKRGFNDDELIKAGLVSRGKNDQCYDRFRNRVIFPIFNIRSEVIAFGGRILDDQESGPKYLNSPDTLVYKKGENLYGLNWARDEIRKTSNAVVMEGYTDVLTAHKSGIKNAIASLGTAFTNQQARLLKRYGSNIYISYDADAAGARATLRGLDILDNEGLNVRVIQLPDQQDPDEFINKRGKSGFGKLEKEAVNLTEFKINQLAKEYDCNKIDEKINFTNNLVKILSDIKDEVKRDIHLQNAAQKYNVESETLKKGIISYYKSKDSKKKDKNNRYRYTKKDNETNHIDYINKTEKNFLKLYIDNPEKRNTLIKYLNPIFFTGDYKDLVKLINNNPDLDLDKLLLKIDKENIKKMLLALSVLDDIESKDDEVIERFLKKIKGSMYNKLQLNQNLRLEEINQILIEFIKLTV